MARAGSGARRHHPALLPALPADRPLPNPNTRTNIMPTPAYIDANDPRHARAYLRAAHTFLTEWPDSWDAEDLRDALISHEENEILDNVVVWAAVETWVDETDDHDFLKAHKLIERMALDMLAFSGDEQAEPLRAFLTEISIRWGEQVTERKHVIQAYTPEEAAKATLHKEASYVGCEPEQLEEDTHGWYSHTGEHFFYGPVDTKEIDPRDAAAVLRYFH